MFKKVAAILALTTLLAYSAVKFPYPQRKNYGNETVNVTSASASGNLKTSFESYMSKFYEENGDKTQARIKFYDPDKPGDDQYTVSEGIGYAMLMTVYFSDATKSYEDQFKRLWAYYKAHTNGNGFMHWKIQGFGSANQQNGATDAELDVVLALLMARYQFDNAQYETDANALMAKVLQYEVSSDNLLKPGDAWDSDRNPSYVAPAAFELFKGTNSKWSDVLTKNYAFLTTNTTSSQSSTTGLPSDWADNSGNPKQCSACGYSGTNYGQDAVRAPWRWATAYAWFGHSQAKTLLTKLASWVSGKNASDVKGPISLSGTMGSNANSSYAGSLMNALMVSSAYQANLNSYWNVVNGFNEASYYNHSMQLLTGLLATGNMPNLKACAAGNCGTDMSTGGGSNKDYTSISKFDWFGFTAGTEEENMSWGANLEPWFVYTDEESHGTSTVTNEKFTTKNESKNCAEEQSYRSVKKVDGEWAATIPSYTFGQGKNRYAPFVAIAIEAKNNGKTYHLEGCTGGFSYKYKGQGHNFKVRTTPVPETSGADYFIAVKTAATAWTEQIVAFADLAQPSWASTAQKVPFKAEEIYGFIWELKGPDAKNCAAGDLDASKGDNYCANPTPGTVDGGISKNTGSLAIKDFRCLGKITFPTSRTNACSEGAIVEGPGDDDGGGEVDPIISLQHKASNAFAVRNGVNLQVSKNAIVEIFSLNGKSISKREFSNGNHTLMLNDLPRGLYIVKVQFGSQKEILRVPVR